MLASARELLEPFFTPLVWWGPDSNPQPPAPKGDALSELPQSGKKFWKMKKIPGQGKVRELHFQSGKFELNEKSHGKVREFQTSS